MTEPASDRERLLDAALDALERKVAADPTKPWADPTKPWAERRGSEGWLAGLMPIGAAVLAVVPQLIGGRALEPIEFTALVVAAGVVAAVYILSRSLIKAEAIRAGKGE